ncbi:MAG: DUF1295 domain-containing protein [Candidatus Cloacimonetes bacterium]|jgi:steroid 5-alpha reductase family enzyme|nr:DUF1295 domain-containing protein [Candidatus Cloacimonadota bacterium]MCB5287124.1 DUF1295 domain-containing protein [Candidatus Cloacimonadota bacterium]MCK9183945.1 DUF1295 domain-containing protein [Candidatus Cloacimonadota bacterium]MCK9584567.1 DUF1295 domain-containing protein [Candidatus Cloacimonadota bacterium]MDY0229445.1 DUF1295 domain-containing protein [Candidatus Cloacimonadaceae bacterium]
MTLFSSIIIVICSVFVYMTTLFLIAVLVKRNDLVDNAWGLGFVLIYWLFMALQPSGDWRRMLITLLITIWALRLSLYLYIRYKGKKEDFRYAQWRKDWGKNWLWRSYLQVFILQGFFMLTIAYPAFMIYRSSVYSFTALDFIAILLWLTGFIFEAVSDAQMSAFKQKPVNKGRVMNKGLWRYSRHPNYFGETLMWWAIFLLCLAYPFGYLAIFSPIIITILLLRVSGIPMLEKKYKDNPEYMQYIRSTSAFIPKFW